VAKWLETHARVLLFDEPARGIDVVAKAELFGLIGELAAAGRAIVLISSYLPELIEMCDRILVLREGEIVASGTPSELIAAAPATEIHYRRNGQEVVIRTEEPTRTLHELTGEAVSAGRELEGLEVRRPTLEEIYLSLTGEGVE
jgi:ABC-type multidrug transport system ATPase subunit